MRKQDITNIFIFFGTLIGGALLFYAIAGFLVLTPRYLTFDMIQKLNLIPISIIGAILFIPAIILFVKRQRRLIPIEVAQEKIDALQTQLQSEVNTARLYASFYRGVMKFCEAKAFGTPITSHIDLEGIISWEFMNASDPNYTSSQQALEKKLKEECVKVWKATNSD